jgi:hypothetical protein
VLAHATYAEIASRLSRSSPRSSARCPCRVAGAREKPAQRDDFTGDPTDGHPARPLEVACGRGAPSTSTTSSSAPRGARTSISTAWWRSVRHAMPKRMPPTPAAGWSSPHSAEGASRSPEGLISGPSARVPFHGASQAYEKSTGFSVRPTVLRVSGKQRTYRTPFILRVRWRGPHEARIGPRW